MEQKPYYEQVDIQNTMKLRELIASLPPFCGTFFRGIEPTTSSRTRIAYAYDLRVFFEFLIKNNPALSQKGIRAITLEDLDKMEELCYYIKDNALCGLGQTAPNPVLSTLRYFRDEYIAHIVDKKCPAGVCKALLSYKIDADKCKGCTLCARNCPNGAISGKLKEPHVIDQSKCLKCGACMEKCRFGAIYKE